MIEPHGVIPALVTPLDRDGNLKEDALRKVIDYTIAGGVHGEFILGSTGEFYGLDRNQKKRAIEVTVEHTGGRVPVYAGASEITTRDCIEMAKMAESIGVDALSVLTPFFISPSEEELHQHFAAIAASTTLPILLYGNPSRTGNNLSPALVERLTKIPNIIGIKDSSGDMTQMAEYIRRNQDKTFYVLSGRDTLILGNLVYGGCGSIAATANIAPAVVSEIYNAFIAGDIARAREYQYKLAPLRMAFGLGTFPVIMKEGLNLVGIDAGVALPPVQPISEENRKALTAIIKSMGLYQTAG